MTADKPAPKPKAKAKAAKTAGSADSPIVVNITPAPGYEHRSTRARYQAPEES